jgi:5-methylcytosine-specific restriction endonuclease McrA
LCPKLPNRPHRPLCAPYARPRGQAGTATARGYGARWQRQAKVIIARDPICALCGVRPSTEADHVLPKSRGGTDDRENLKRLCAGKTMTRDGGFGRYLSKFSFATFS